MLFAVRFGGDAQGCVLRLLQQHLVVDSGVRELLRQLPKTGLVRSLKQSVCGLRVCLLSIKQLQVLNIIEYSLCFFSGKFGGRYSVPLTIHIEFIQIHIEHVVEFKKLNLENCLSIKDSQFTTLFRKKYQSEIPWSHVQ